MLDRTAVVILPGSGRYKTKFMLVTKWCLLRTLLL